MSLSVSDAGTGVEYAGALGARGLFAQRSSLRSRDHWRMLLEIPRFHRRARAVLGRRRRRVADQTLRDFLADGRFSARFVRHFMEPLVAAVWSCDPATSLDYPARYLFTFLEHHGMLGVFGSPEWRTVTGGSGTYVAAVARRTPRRPPRDQGDLGPRARRRGRGHRRQWRHHHLRRGRHRHPPGPARSACSSRPATSSARSSPRSPTAATRRCCTPTSRCSPTPATPAPRGTSTGRPDETGQVTVTYDLTRLQRLPTDTHYLVTLGGEDLVDPATVIDRMEYEHPLYTPESVAASRRLPEINTDRIAFAGAYHGWGFHEDGARSGLVAATHLGLPWTRTTHAVPQTGALHDDDPPHPPYAVHPHLRARLDLLAGRPRRPARPRAPRPLRGPRPPGLAGAHAARQRRGVPRRPRRHPRHR